MKTYQGFTLAEVLITLGIIGIVAAMTLPALTGSYKNQERSARVKKFYSMMSQVILLSENENGPIEYWEKGAGDIKNEDGEHDMHQNGKECQQFFNKYIKKYIKNLKSETAENNESLCEYKIIFADGSSLCAHNGVCMDLIYDINGEKQPDKEGYDRFRFIICTGNDKAVDTAVSRCGSKDKRFCTYGPNIYKTRETAYNACKTAPAYCSTLLQYDNFEFKKDYPFKL